MICGSEKQKGRFWFALLQQAEQALAEGAKF